MEEKCISEKVMQEARRYAICIAGEAHMFRDFAVNMIDYIGPEICPYLKELYKELSQMLFTRAIRQDDQEYVESLSEDEIMSWYYSFNEYNKHKEEHVQEEFKENIDELQFLVKEFREKDEFQKMLDFVGKFNHIAPYNAMLIEMQKPGCVLVLKGNEWYRKYNRQLKPNAQRLITLRQFGPVQCMFDISDTEPIPGKEQDDDAKILERWNNSLKRTQGTVDKGLYEQLVNNLPSYGIYLDDSFNASNTFGGYVMPFAHEISLYVHLSEDPIKYKSRFLISVNRTQTMTEKFHTICHELGHVFCRHQSYNYEKTRSLSLKQREFEAETVAWLMCKRHGIDNASEEYLATYAPEGTIPICSTEYIMKSVTEIERMLEGAISPKNSLWYKEDKRFKSDLDAVLKTMKNKKKTKRTEKKF